MLLLARETNKNNHGYSVLERETHSQISLLTAWRWVLEQQCGGLLLRVVQVLLQQLLLLLQLLLQLGRVQLSDDSLRQVHHESLRLVELVRVSVSVAHMGESWCHSL